MSATTADAFTSLLPRRGSPAVGNRRPFGAARVRAAGRRPPPTPLAHPRHEGVAAALVGALPLRGIAVDEGPQVERVREAADLVLDLEKEPAVVGVHDGL